MGIHKHFSKAGLLCFLAALVLSHNCFAASPCPAEVRVGLPDFPVPPLLYGSANLQDPPGEIVTWVQNAVANSGCRPIVSIRRLPLKRLEAELRAGTVDIAPGFGPATLNNAPLEFPMRAGKLDTSLMIVRDRLWLYVRADDSGIGWDGTKLSVEKAVVGISAGISATRIEVIRHGWVADIAKNPEGNLIKLNARRIDAILESDLWLEATLKSAPKFEHRIRKLEPAVATVERYAPVTSNFFMKFPDYTRRFWQGMRQESTAKK